MVDNENENVVLRLLREIRAEMRDLREEQAVGNRRLSAIDRRIDDMKESVVMALGMAGHTNVVVERTGETFDELRDQIEALRHVSELEIQK